MGKSFALLALASMLMAIGSQSAGAQGEALPRRGVLGAAVAQDKAHVVIAGILPNSAAAQAGLEKGDIVAALDGKPVLNVAEFFVQAHRSAGQPITLTLTRGMSMVKMPTGI